MAKINQYFGGNVGLPNPNTTPQQSYNTPVADAIGQAADVAGQFAQKYQQAKYSRSKIDTMLTIKQNVNAYQENLRTNPITQQGPDDDIVSLKEQDWQKFSDKQIKENVLGQIKDPRLAEEMNSWWNNETENYRASLVDMAMDENIAYMGQRLSEDVDTAIYNGQYALALGLTETGIEDGLFSREYQDGIKDQVALQAILSETDKMDIKQAEQVINESPLEADQKILANKYMKERKAVRAADIEKTVKQYDSESYLNLYMAAQNGDIRSSEQLTAIFQRLPNAMYGDEELDGTATDFAAKHMVSLMSVINSKNKGEESKAETLSDDIKLEAMSLMATKTRGEVLQYGVDNINKKGYGIEFYDYLTTEMKDPKWERLNPKTEELYKIGEKDLLDGEYITESQRIDMYEKYNSWLTNYTDEQIMTEAYVKDLPEFFNQMKAEQTKYRIDDLQKTIMNYADGKMDYVESFIRRGNMGDYTGSSDPKILNDYINSPSGDITAFKDAIADYNGYGKTYDELDKDQKNRVDLSLAIAEHSKSVLRLAEQTIGKGGRIVIDPSTNMPKVRFGENEDYRLQINPETQEEQWYQFGKLTPDDRPRWYPANIDIPITTKDPGFLGHTLKTYKDFVEKSQFTYDLPEDEVLSNQLLDRLNPPPGAMGTRRQY